jgi:uncharacterized protein with PIN domain
MLGTLARYLRSLGYDTLYPPEGVTDAELLFLAYVQGRILLTRDTRMGTGVLPKVFVLKSVVPEEQLKEVIKRFRLRRGKSFLTRCLVCNAPLVKIEKDEVRGRVPSYVFRQHNKFARCSGCRKYYWTGTHTKRMLERVKRWKAWMK